MPSCNITKTHIIYAAGAIILIGVLVGGGKMLINHSGSSGVKEAVEENNRCQQLKSLGVKPYLDCQKELDNLISKLVAEKELDVKNQCKANPEEASAQCTVTVWFATKHIVTTDPGILQKVNESAKETESSIQTITTGLRRKRAAESHDLYLQDNLVRHKRGLYKKVIEKVQGVFDESNSDSDSDSKSSSSSDQYRKRAGRQGDQKPGMKTENTATYIRRGSQR